MAVSQMPNDHEIVLRKMAEICGSEWPLDLLQWMYLINEDRNKLIWQYQAIINDAESGEIEIGTREEAFKNDA